MALKKGTPTAPGWVLILDAAKDWGKMPWEIVKRPGPVIWWLRYKIYHQEVSRAAAKEL